MLQSGNPHWLSKPLAKAVLAIFSIAYFAALPGSQTQAQDIEVSVVFELKTGTREGLLTVTADIPNGWHTYSLTQPENGPTRSTLKLSGTDLQLVGDFVPQQEPEKHDEEFMGPVEELRGVVFWAARIQLSPDVDPTKLKAGIDLYAQICTDETKQCKPPITYSGEIDFVGENADLQLPDIPEKPVEESTNPRLGFADTEYFKLVETDTPEQIAAMAQLYDVNEPIEYIDFQEMSQFPGVPSRSEPVKQIPMLLVLLVIFAFGAIISLMVYMLFNRSIETKKTPQEDGDKQDGDKPVYPRMRGIALAAVWFFSICIAVSSVLLISENVPWKSNSETKQSAMVEPPTGSITWANWHPGKVAQQLNQNRIVWVDYTAAWDPTSKLNEARVASNSELVERMNKMNVSFIAVDLSQRDEPAWRELTRTDTLSTPVNLIYPPNYPEEPAIKFEYLVSPADVHLVLDRMEAITAKLKE